MDVDAAGVVSTGLRMAAVPAGSVAAVSSLEPRA